MRHRKCWGENLIDAATMGVLRPVNAFAAGALAPLQRSTDLLAGFGEGKGEMEMARDGK